MDKQSRELKHGDIMRNLNYGILVSILLTLVVSCSGTDNPVTPGDPVAEPQRAVDCPGTRVYWGTWHIYISEPVQNPEILPAVEIVPIRGPVFQANVIKFLQPPVSPLNLLSIDIDPSETDISQGKITCDVTITHPFPGTKFSGFDVAGIVMDDYDWVPFTSDPEIVTSIPPNTLLQNPDGWTRWWNESEFTSYGTVFGYTDGSMANTLWTSIHTLNAYKFFCDDLEAEDPFDPPYEGRGFFSSEGPGINSRRYVLRFPLDAGPVFHYKYAVSASWMAPYETAVAPFTADDYPPGANMPEAYKIDFIDEGSSVFYENETTFGGELAGFIEVRDWQFDGNLSSVQEEISEVVIESPTLFPGSISIDLGATEAVAGNPTAFRIPFMVGDVTPSGIDNQLLFVTVKSVEPSTYEPQVPGISGFDYPEGTLAAYAILDVPVFETDPNIPPVAIADDSGPQSGVAPLPVNLDPSPSFDPDGEIVLYEWDYESDGSYEASTVTPDIVEHTFYGGTHSVTLRVTDDDNAVGTDTVQIDVDIAPPVANAGASEPIFGLSPLEVNLDPSLSYDPDGSLVLYEWDFESDGAYDISTVTPDIVLHSYFSGPQAVTLRVTDNDLQTDTDAFYVYPGEEQLGWPTYRRTNDRAGRTPVIGPTTDNIKFVWEIPDLGSKYIGSGIVLDSQNRAIFVGRTGYLYCVDQTGELAWKCFINAWMARSTPAVAPDDSIFVGNHSNKLWHIGSDGEVIWTYGSGYFCEICGGIAVMPDGSVLFSTTTGSLRKVDAEGELVWGHAVGSKIKGGPAVGDDGTIYVANDINKVCAVDQNGDEVWKTQCGTTNHEMHGAPALGPYGIYIGSTDGNLYCLDYDGGIQWETPIGDDILNTIAVGDDGNVYLGSKDGFVYCVDQISGDIEWSYDTANSITDTSIILDGDGHLYGINYLNSVICLTTDGDYVWSYSIVGATASRCPAIADDGTLLVGGYQYLYAFKDE